jgi:murein DD-endopeptidase MepM/ murein hydrolase activator NlpD
VRVKNRRLTWKKTPQYGRPHHRVFLTMLLVAGFSVAGYLCFVPVLAGHMNRATVASLPVQAANPSAGESRSLANPPSAFIPSPDDGTIEIEEFSGQGDTLYSLLSANLPEGGTSLKVAKSLARAIESSTDTPFDINRVLKPERRYSITVDKDGRFLRATVELDPAHVFHAVLRKGRVRSWKEDVVLDFKEETMALVVKSTLTETIINAGEGKELANRVANVFRWDIDFQSETKNGDVCKILFERRYADDRPSGYGRILCVVYHGKKTGRKTAVLFNNNYYNEKARELKKNFLRSPLNTLRVTSRYGQRFHPILKVWRKHNGVDYGAPRGTSVWSVARGTVTFAGWKKGYGKYVCIKHDNNFESRYGHLSRILVKKGQRVNQRQRIGKVGQTGLATGPHLDFQLLVNGKHKDPLKVKMVKSLRKIPAPLQPRFSSLAQKRLLRLNNHFMVQRSGVRNPTALQ